MKKMKLNAIFVDLYNEKQYQWVLKMKKLNLIKNISILYNNESSGIVVKFDSPIKWYIIWRNNRFLGKEIAIVGYDGGGDHNDGDT